MPNFSVLTWVYPQLPTISSLDWTPAWPADFNDLPRGCYRLADDSAGILTSEGEGSAAVGVYIDTWAATPELRESYDALVQTAMEVAGLYRGMKRHVEEPKSDGITVAYRSTCLYSGEYDHSEARMFAP